MSNVALKYATEVPNRSLLSLQEARNEGPEDILYECTADMQYLRQYFFIREYAYRVDLQLKNFSGAEDEIDQYSHFIVARKGHFVVGGSRLTISSPNKRVRLPLEHGNFQVATLLPELSQDSYCELGRTAILPDYRTGQVLDNIFKLSADIAKRLGCTHMAGVSPPAVARRFKHTYQQLGYQTNIREDIAVPVAAIHEHLRLKFILVNLVKN